MRAMGLEDGAATDLLEAKGSGLGAEVRRGYAAFPSRAGRVRTALFHYDFEIRSHHPHLWWTRGMTLTAPSLP